MSSIGLNNIKCPNDFKIYYKSGGAVPVVSATPSATPSITLSITPSISGCVDPLTVGLVGCWNLEEVSGILYDGSGNDNNFTTTSNITYQKSGKVGSYCVGFPNTNSYALDGSDSSLDLITYSVSCWIKLTGTTANKRQILVRGRYSGGYEVYVDNFSGHVGMHNWSGTTNQGGQFLSTPVTDGNWHHIVVTYNDISQQANCYIDSVITTPLSITVPPSIPSTPKNLCLGNDPYYSYTYGFGGDIDAVNLFNRELTQCDVNRLYNSGSGVSCPIIGPTPTPSISTSNPISSSTPTPSISVTPSISISATPSISVTPSTEIYYYYGDLYNCDGTNCSAFQYTTTFYRTTPISQINKFYKAGSGVAYIYGSPTGGTEDGDIFSGIGYNDCQSACLFG